MYDKFEQIAAYGQLPVTILGCPETSDFVLIDLMEPLPDAVTMEDFTKRRGMFYLGAVGIMQGYPRAALAVPLSEDAIVALSSAYTSHVQCALNGRLRAAADKLRATPAGDFAEWLSKLVHLQDPRGGAN